MCMCVCVCVCVCVCIQLNLNCMLFFVHVMCIPALLLSVTITIVNYSPQDRRRENLKIREDGVGGVYVESLSEHVVRNTDGVMSLLREGAQLRTTASTRMNKV